MSEDLTPYTSDLPEELSAYPVWRQAALDAVATFAYGDTITHAWLAEHLEIATREGLMSVEKHRQLDFEVLRKVDGFRDVMLSEHKRYLVNVRGHGYRIVAPPQQTGEAIRRLSVDVQRSVGKAMAALVHVNEQVLSLEDMRENADAKARVGWLNAIGIKQLRPQKSAPSGVLEPTRLRADTPQSAA